MEDQAALGAVALHGDENGNVWYRQAGQDRSKATVGDRAPFGDGANLRFHFLGGLHLAFHLRRGCSATARMTGARHEQMAGRVGRRAGGARP